jgi:phenylacetate-CoA ligase
VPGRILVTDLTNYTMPFLRYQLEDIGSWAEGLCACGRPFRRLAKIWGRSTDFVVTPQGKIIHGEYFTHLFYGLPQIQTFQLVQETRESVRLEYVLRPGVTEFPLEELHRRTQAVLGASVLCEIKRVDQISRPASGKHRFTISKVRPPWGMNSQMDDNV